MAGIAEYLPSKSRHPRKWNTRWLIYAHQNGIIKPVPATGKVLKKDGTEYFQYTNPFGYKYIKVYMHQTWFSFYVHKCIYYDVNRIIHPDREIDHIDGNLEDNRGCNLMAITTKKNLAKRKKKEKTEAAF